MHDYRIPPLADPAPLAPREDVAGIATADLPAYAKTAEEWWLIANRIWPAILDIFDRVKLPTDDAERLRAARDIGLADLLNDAWIKAPDAYYIHSWPQWARFCDLCSECHVLLEATDGR